MNNEDLVLQAKKGDMESFSKLYEIYKNSIYYFALKNVKNKNDAEEIVQETFMEAFKRIDTLTDANAFKSWIFQIGYRKCIALFRKNGRTIQIDNEDYSEYADYLADETTESLPEESLATEETKRVVMKLIDGLPELQRTAVLMYYYEELPVKQIAEIQECSENTIKGRLLYARKAIKDKIEQSRKKGVSLLTFAPFPLLVAIFKEDALACTLSEEVSGAILNNVLECNVQGATATTTGATTKAGLSVGTKIAIGVSSVVVVVGIVFGVIMNKSEGVALNTTPPTIVENAQNVNNQTVGDTPTTAPSTFSDYAKLFYEYVKENHVGKEGFLDAEMISIGNDELPVFLLAYSNKIDIFTYNNEFLQIAKTVPNTREGYATEIYIAKSDEENFIITHVLEPSKIITYSDRNLRNPAKNLNFIVYIPATESDGIRIDIPRDDGSHYLRKIEGAEFDEKLAYFNNQLAIQPLTTFGIRTGGVITDRLFEHTYGERLKEYFK